MKLLIYTLASLLLALNTFGKDATAWIENGNRTFQKADYDSAIFFFSKAKNEFHLNADNAKEFSVHLKIISSLLKSSEFAQAENEIELAKAHFNFGSESDRVELVNLNAQLKTKQEKTKEALALYDSVVALSKDPIVHVKATIWKGLTHIGNHDLDGAQVAMDDVNEVVKVNKISDNSLMSSVYDLEAHIRWHTGDFSGALKWYHKALPLRVSELGTSHPDVGSLYNRMGIMYKNLLQYDKALEFYTLALDQKRKYLGEDHVDVSHTYNNIGYLLYKKGRFDEAMTIHKKALAIRNKHLDKNHRHVLQSKEHIGLCHGGKGEFEEAEEYFRSTLNARIEVYGAVHHLVGYAYYNLGAVAVEERDYNKAADYFFKAIEIGKEVYGPHNYDQADNYNRLANCYLALGKTNEAKNTFQLGLQHNLPGHAWSGNQNEIPDVSHYLSYREVLRSLLGLAKAHSTSLDKKSFDLSVAYLDEVEKLIQKFKLSLSNEGDLVTISSSYKQLADYAVDIHHRYFQETNNTQLLGAIFRYTELSKGSALLSKLQDEKAKLISGIPDQILKDEKNLLSTQDSLSNQVLKLLSENPSSTALSETKTKLFEVSRTRELLIASMEDNYPSYANRKYGTSPIDLEKLQEFLASRERTTSIITYHHSDTEELLTSIITANHYDSKLSQPANLNQRIEQLRSALLNQETEAFEDASQSLYTCLVAPIANELVPGSDLIIIPDGVIGFVPFDVLLKDEKESYMLLDHTITYDLSATLFATREGSSKGDKLLAYAPEFESTGSTVEIGDVVVRSEALVALPGAQDEVSDIAKIMNGSTRVSSVATETMFKKEAKDYDILHLATHSIVNEKDADYSKLIFAKDDEEDGQLHAFELANMTLNARLVTLSACNTGFGKIEEGEGVMSLARAFRSAGVQSVVMSLWPASDKSTPELMKSFYKNLDAGQPKDLALNNARKEYLKNATGKAKHPFYWGGFVMIGDNSPLTAQPQSFAWLIIVALVAVVVTVVASRRKLRDLVLRAGHFDQTLQNPVIRPARK